jgi:hypothetical protein
MAARRALPLLALSAAALAAAPAATAPKPAVVVYSATGGGFAAAVAAARAGAAVTLVGATGGGGTGAHVGGMTTGGLQHADCGNASVLGGLAREFFERVESQYPGRPTGPGLQPCTGPPCWLYEAHVAEAVMRAMLAEAGVAVVEGQEGVAAVETAPADGAGPRRVTALRTLAGGAFAGDVFIDASYEGDLLAAAGAATTFGREPAAQYGEPGGGVRPLLAYDQLPPGVDPLWPDGTPLPLLTTGAAPGGFGPVGAGDAKLEAATYRLCMTRAPSRRVPVNTTAPPPRYNASTYELFRRVMAARPPASLSAFLDCLGPVPTDAPDCPPDANATRRWCKCDMIGGGGLGSDLPGGAWAWPNATVPQRRAIAAAHTDYVAGMLWFLAADPAVPAAVRAEMADYGLCADEWADTQPPHWPHQLYVREARRLVGDFVLTQNAPPAAYLNRSIGVGSYAYDAHTVQRGVVAAPGGGLYAANEGEIVSQPPAYQPPYRVPYDALLPARAQLSNVLAAVPVSASHVAFTSLRMETTWMVLGAAAGTAAAAAGAAGVAVQDVDVPALQAALVAAGQIITE